jgi:hypothetical protein
MKYGDIMRVLEKVLQKLDVIITVVSGTPTVQMLFSPALSPTVNALKALGGSGSALQVSQVTGRARAVESNYLNELYRTGLAQKSSVKGARGCPARIFTLKEVDEFEGEAVER